MITTVTVPAVTVEVDLSDVARLMTGEDGRLIALSYHHEAYYPHSCGPVLQFELPDGRVVITEPTADGYDLRWKDTLQYAVLDDGPAEVVHLMWDQINGAFAEALLAQFTAAAAVALAGAITDPTP